MMSILDRFRKKQAHQSNKVTISRNLRSMFIPGNYTLENSEIIFSAVSRLSNTLSSMPIRLYQNLSLVNNDLNNLMQFEPSPNMTSCNFIKTLEAIRNTSGNAYALKILNDNMELIRIDILNPSLVTPLIDEISNELWYKIQTPKREIILHNYYVLHFQFVSTNGYIGINPVNVLFNTLEYSDRIKKFSLNALDKGINAKIVLEAPSNLGESRKKDMINTFVQTYQETGGDILLLESGVTAKALNLSPVDMKLFEVEKITRSKVAMVYNIPPHMLGDYTESSFSSMEQQMLEYLTLTMTPIVTMYEQEFNRKLLTRNQRAQGYYFKFDTNAILRADASTMADVNYKLIRSAGKTPNEIRKDRGLEPKPNGDQLMISRDLIPLDVVIKNPELLLAGKKGGDSN